MEPYTSLKKELNIKFYKKVALFTVMNTAICWFYLAFFNQESGFYYWLSNIGFSAHLILLVLIGYQFFDFIMLMPTPSYKTFVRESRWVTVPELIAELETIKAIGIGDSLIFNRGWGCGYVILPENHPLHGKKADIERQIYVHGGVSYSELIDDKMIEGWEQLTIYDKRKWIVGFDTEHLGNEDEKTWTKEKVKEETKFMMQQFIIIAQDAKKN